jgi:hypothetical protein
MESPLSSDANPPLDWIDIGPLPQAVVAKRDQRAARLIVIGNVVSAVVTGSVAGYVATIFWTGASTWPIGMRLELFAAVALLVGAADFVVYRRYLVWIFKLKAPDIRRVALSNGKLHYERASGGSSAVKLSDVSVSSSPFAEDWFSVTLFAGSRASQSFLAPSAIASVISAAREADQATRRASAPKGPKIAPLR